MFKKYILPLIIALGLGAVNFYITLPALNIKYGGFWSLIIFMVIAYVVSMLRIFAVTFSVTRRQSSISSGVSPTKRC